MAETRSWVRECRQLPDTKFGFEQFINYCDYMIVTY